MKQHYKNYTNEQAKVWKILFDRQAKNLGHKGSKVYLDCLSQMKSVLNADQIPNFDDLTDLLSSKNGWQIEVVKGLIPVDDFFQLLSEKKFCSSTWIRQRNQIDYLEEPDMFHDIFGHIPLLLDETYSNFTHKLGMLGVKYKAFPSIVLQLQRIYWFTIEFGLIREGGQLKCYGAGLISSFGETNHVFSNKIKIESYDVIEVIEQEFITDQVQHRYRVIDNFQSLINSVNELERLIELKLNSKPERLNKTS